MVNALVVDREILSSIDNPALSVREQGDVVATFRQFSKYVQYQQGALTNPSQGGFFKTGTVNR